MARLPRLLLVGVLAAVIAPLSGQSPSPGKPSITNGEWPDYSGDLRGWRYSPLDQINASNFNQLQVAWRFKTDNLGPRPEYKLEGTPVMVKGMLYTTGGTRRSVVSLDGQDRRAELGSQPARRASGSRLTAAVVGPRRLVLDRRQRRRARDLRHDRIPARRARREDGRHDSVVRQQRGARPEGRRRQGGQSADRSRVRRDRHPFDARRRRRHRHHRIVVPRRRDGLDA